MTAARPPQWFFPSNAEGGDGPPASHEAQVSQGGLSTVFPRSDRFGVWT